MKLRLKIILPLMVFFICVVGILTYLLQYLSYNKQLVANNIQAIKEVNDLTFRIITIRQNIERTILSYRYTKNVSGLDVIDNYNKEITIILGQLRGMLTASAASDFLDLYEETRVGAREARIDLINAINQNDELAIQLYFNKWDIHSANTQANLQDFVSYNIQTLENVYIAYDQILLRLYVISIVIIITTITGLLVLFIYLKVIVTEPIEKLSRFSSRISQGHFNTTHTVRSNDELGMLGEHLDTMAKNLKQYYKSLRNEVLIKEEQIRQNNIFEEQKNDFINIASHELKTPVTSLKVFLHLMNKMIQKNNHQEYGRYLQKMDEQINRLVGLITSLLDITKMNSGVMPYEMTYFDIHKVIMDIIEIAKETATKHTIVFQGTCDKKIYGDENRIHQVIDNLISNAIKYSPEGGTIRILLSHNTRYVNIDVRDNGIGIDKIHQKKIFSRFYRVNDKDEKTFPGLGIGLYVSAEIIRKHKGKLTVTSVKGRGSTFSIRLPLAGKK
jgi:signal transduction histidine kinase